MGRLDGKVAIITGAASGMGAAEARLFADEGAKVVATDVQEELLRAVVNDIVAKHGDVAIAVKHDVADENDWIEVVRQAVAKFGKIDILINNAGITGKTLPLSEYAVEEWNRVIEVNATGNFLGIKHVVPEMKKAGKGSIVNISSIAGLNGMAGISAYGASKGATRILTKGAANALGPDNIRVNSIHPGYIETPMIAPYTASEEVKNQLIASIPLRRLGKPEDVAYMALFLASDESDFVTGAEFVVDGGQTIVI